MPPLNKKCHMGLASTSRSKGFCTRMYVWATSGGSVGRSITYFIYGNEAIQCVYFCCTFLTFKQKAPLECKLP